MIFYTTKISLYSSLNFTRNSLWLFLRLKFQGWLVAAKKSIKIHTLRSAHGHKASRREHLIILNKFQTIKGFSQVGLHNLTLIGLFRNPGQTFNYMISTRNFFQKQTWFILLKFLGVIRKWPYYLLCT